MTRYLLDTNVFSDTLKPRPSSTLMDWLARQYDDDLFVSTQTLAELWFGIQSLPLGRRRADLAAWFKGPTGPLNFGVRIQAFDQAAALCWGEIMGAGKMMGRPRSGPDMIIAATALVNDCVLVTDNERDFEGVVEMINPVRGAIS